MAGHGTLYPPMGRFRRAFPKMAITFASSLIICAPFQNRFKVLLLKRSSFGFYGDLCVFPGGSLDIQDSNPYWNCQLPKNQPLDSNLRLCAIRETFEECGLMYGKFTTVQEVRDKKVDFITFCKSKMIVPNTLGLYPFANWVSPLAHPKRFDTMFYLAKIPEMVQTFPDNHESVSSIWVTPKEALELFREQKISILAPQFCILQELQLLDFDKLTTTPRKVPKICPEIMAIDKTRNRLKLNRDPLLNIRKEQLELELVLETVKGKVSSIKWANNTGDPLAKL